MGSGAEWSMTALGHSCVLVVVANEKASARILIDPGNLTPPINGLEPVDAVLVTHAHPDHVDPEQLRRVLSDGPAPVYAPRAAVDQLVALGVVNLVAVDTGQSFTIAGTRIEVEGAAHEPIYQGVPLPENVAYRIGSRVYAPGDSFAGEIGQADVLLLPLAGPWMRLAQAVDYLRAASPPVAVLVHDAGLAEPHRLLHREIVTWFAPTGTQVLVPSPGDRFVL